MRSLLTVSEEWGETGQKCLVVAVIAARRPAVRTAASGARVAPAVRAAASVPAARSAGRGPTVRATAGRGATIAAIGCAGRRPIVGTASSVAAAVRPSTVIRVSATRRYHRLLHAECSAAGLVASEVAARVVWLRRDARTRIVGAILRSAASFKTACAAGILH